MVAPQAQPKPTSGKYLRYPSTLISYKGMSFLIIDAPVDTSLPQYISELRKYNAKHLVRACEATYHSSPLVEAGIEIHELPFADGEPPPKKVPGHGGKGGMDGGTAWAAAAAPVLCGRSRRVVRGPQRNPSAPPPPCPSTGAPRTPRAPDQSPPFPVDPNKENFLQKNFSFFVGKIFLLGWKEEKGGAELRQRRGERSFSRSSQNEYTGIALMITARLSHREGCLHNQCQHRGTARSELTLNCFIAKKNLLEMRPGMRNAGRQPPKSG